MKAKSYLIVCLTASALAAFAQQPQPPQPATPPSSPTPGGFNERLTKIITRAAGDAAPAPTLTKFSLDFPGGMPKQLVDAIAKAMGRPLNVIIPAEHAEVKLPPLKMNNVDVSQLFQALELTSQKTEAYVTGTSYGGLGSPQQNYQQMRTSYGFRTQGRPSDDSIWYFYAEKPSLPPLPPVPPIAKVCRFYPLSPYLERGQTVDDITTAIQTGWRMLGDKETPTISFHKETKLLIAVGDPDKLQTIDAVLKALDPTPQSPMDALHEQMSKNRPPTPLPLAVPAPVRTLPLPVRTPKLPEAPEAGQ